MVDQIIIIIFVIGIFFNRFDRNLTYSAALT